MTRTCEEIRPRLHDWVDGTVDPAARESIRGHLDGCAACRDQLDDLERLRAEAARLPRELAAARDLWPAIESRLERGWWRRLAAAAAVDLRPRPALLAAAAALLALAVGIGFWRAQPASTDRATRVDVEAPASTDAGILALALLARSEDGTLGTRNDLLAAVEGQKEHLSPETVAVLEENMLIIDRAIGQLRSALDEDPLNRRLSMRLAAQYQREANLIKRVSGA